MQSEFILLIALSKTATSTQSISGMVLYNYFIFTSKCDDKSIDSIEFVSIILISTSERAAN